MLDLPAGQGHAPQASRTPAATRDTFVEVGERHDGLCLWTTPVPTETRGYLGDC